MRIAFLLSVVILTAYGQTIAVTSPASNQAISGTSFPLAVSLTNLSNVYSVEYDVDGELAGISRTGSYSYVWNSYFASNGRHTLVAIARNAAKTILATSPAVSFTVENNQPQQPTLGPTLCTPGSSGSSGCTDVSVALENVAYISGGSVSSVFEVNSYKCTGTCAVRSGTPQYSAWAASPRSVTLANTVTGDAVVGWVAINNNSPTATVTVGGISATMGTQVPCAGGAACAIQPFYLLNITGASSTTVTATSSGQTIEVWAWDVQNVATSSALDVVQISTVNPAHIGFTLAQANEIVLELGTTGAGGSATSGWVGTSGWTYGQDVTSGYHAAAQTIIPPSSGWWGIEGVQVTVNGPNSGLSKSFTFFVDGFTVQTDSSITSATDTGYIDTGTFLNGASAPVHQVLVRADACSGCASSGKWTDMGAWEQPETFNNPTVFPMQLLASARESFLCLTATTNCPTSSTISASYLNTDGSTTATTISTCVYNPSGGAATPTGPGSPVFTTSVSGGNCVLTQSLVGFDYATITAPNGMTRKIWAGVADPTKWTGVPWTIPNFAADRSIQRAYSASPQSLWYAGMFQSGSPFHENYTSPLNTSIAANAGLAYAQAGFNFVDWTSATPSYCNSTTNTAFETCINGILSGFSTAFTNYGQGKLKFLNYLGDSWFRGTPEMSTTMLGPGASWAGPCYGTSVTPCPAYQDLMTMSAASGIVMNHVRSDESDSSWGSNYLEGTNTSGIIIGTNGFTQITGTGSTCTITWNEQTLNGSGQFIITGSGQSALDYNTTTNTPIFSKSGSTSTTLIFNCTYSGTLTTGTTQIHPYVNYTFDASLKQCNPNGGVGGSYSAGPCTQWLHYDIFKTISAWEAAAPGAPWGTWSAGGGCAAANRPCASGTGGPGGIVGGLKVGSWNNNFQGGVSADYLPGEKAINNIIGAQGDGARVSLNWMDQTTPLIEETQGLVNNYAYQSYPIAVASCLGNIITTSVPHGLANVPQPDFAQIIVSGSSGGTCDGDYYIVSTPTATTISVVQANASFSGTGNSGTLTFADGSTFTPAAASGIISSSTGNGPGTMNVTQACPGTFRNKRGQTFTVSGSSNSSVNAMTGYFDWLTLDGCGTLFWRQVPNLASSTGGTALIAPGVNYIRGISWATNSDVGPLYASVSVDESAIAGASGSRAYVWTQDQQFFDRTATGVNNCLTLCGGANFTFNPQDPGFYGHGAVQAGMNPVTDYMQGAVFRMTLAHANANILHSALAQFEYGQRLPTPDYGARYEAAARTSSHGNVLEILSLKQNTETCTANLSPYLVSGQPIYRYYKTWSGITLATISAGTTSDTMTCEPGALRTYIFPRGNQYMPEQPALSVSMADVPSASDLLIQYAYTPLSFQSGVLALSLPNTYDCGNIGSCTLPVDLNLGHVYYRLVYLDSNSRTLATSDVQTW